MTLSALASSAGTDGFSLSGKSRTVSCYEGLLIDSIEIDNRNIYDTDDDRYDGFIFRMTNRLHIRTRAKIINREILFKVGSVYSTALAEETARNLRTRLVLYDAWIEPELLQNGKLLIRVVTIDQWSLSGGLNASREGNEVNLRFSVLEKNLFGNNQILGFTHFFEESKKDHFTAGFTDNRIFGKPLRLKTDFSNNPEVNFRKMTVEHPYYNLSQRFSYSLNVTGADGYRDIYNDEDRVAQSEYSGDFAGLGVSYRIGSNTRKAGFALKYDYRFERTFSDTIFTENPEDTALAQNAVSSDSLYHRIGLTADISTMDFIKLQKIDGFGYTEDFRLGPSVAVDMSRSLNTDSVVYDALGLGFAYTGYHHSSLICLSGEGQLWFRHRSVIRQLIDLTLKSYCHCSDYLVLAVKVNYTSDWKPNSANSLILSGTTGLRGYAEHFRTGDRRAIVNLESRIYPELEVLSVMFGAVAFVDAGRTWKSGEPLSVNGLDASAGIGLRLSFEKSSKTALMRCDVAYSERNGWQLSIGSGQYFRAIDD